MSVALSPAYSVAPQALHHHLPSVDLPGALTPSSGTGLGGVGPWQEPGDGVPLCSEVPCADPDPGVWATARSAVWGHRPVPGTAAMACPAPGCPFQPSPLLSQECPGTAHALVWEPGLSIYLELALHSLTQGGAARVTPRWRALDAPTLPGLTLLRASAPVLLPVLVVTAHVGATHARIDIFTERYF